MGLILVVVFFGEIKTLATRNSFSMIMMKIEKDAGATTVAVQY